MTVETILPSNTFCEDSQDSVLHGSGCMGMILNPEVISTSEGVSVVELGIAVQKACENVTQPLKSLYSLDISIKEKIQAIARSYGASGAEYSEPNPKTKRINAKRALAQARDPPPSQHKKASYLTMTDSSLPISSANVHRLLTKSADTSKPNFIPFTGRKSVSFAFGFTFIFTFLLLYIQSFSGHSFPFSSLISHFLANSSSLSHQHHALLNVPNESPLADAKYGVHSLSQEYNNTSEKNPLLSAGLNDNVEQHGKVGARNDSHGEEEQYALKRENGNKEKGCGEGES
ncbi:hypothetical protein OIU76_017121 [Salix suchowensis]|nr:hypothetical protein OIU76_017121 [Salix suchowensis]